MTHHCHATDCNREIKPELFMCAKHWHMVPKELRDLIWHHYKDGQCETKRPSTEYCMVASLAVEAVAEKESRIPNTDLYKALIIANIKGK